ncbi:MAG: class I SAM-dependent methyltransferase, partial [Planctomycetota bacterium]
WCEPVALLGEVRRVLRPGGLLAVYDHHLAGRMEDTPGFDAWYAAHQRRFPRASRHAKFDPARAPAYSPVSRERFESLLPLSCEQLVLYLVSQSNVLSAVESGRATQEGAAAELRAGLLPLFAGRASARLVYAGELDLLEAS